MTLTLYNNQHNIVIVHNNDQKLQTFITWFSQKRKERKSQLYKKLFSGDFSKFASRLCYVVFIKNLVLRGTYIFSASEFSDTRPRKEKKSSNVI